MLVLNAGHRCFSGNWASWNIPRFATLNLLATPASECAEKPRPTPPGFLAVAGSFALFAAATGLALIKGNWDKSKPAENKTGKA